MATSTAAGVFTEIRACTCCSLLVGCVNQQCSEVFIPSMGDNDGGWGKICLVAGSSEIFLKLSSRIPLILLYKKIKFPGKC